MLIPLPYEDGKLDATSVTCQIATFPGGDHDLYGTSSWSFQPALIYSGNHLS